MRKRLYFMRMQTKYLLRHLKPINVKKVFFILSTGRCGTKFVASALNLAPNATVLHEPEPGCEFINPVAYSKFVKEKSSITRIRVQDFLILKLHATVYRDINTEIFGDCYNSVYPFGIALFNYFSKQGIEVKFIHLIRHPTNCCSSILRAEGAYGIGIRKNFGLRASLLRNTDSSAEIASNIWIKINELIQYQMNYIESKKPNSTRLIKIDDLKSKEDFFPVYNWLGMELPQFKELEKIITSQDDNIKHSHQKRLDILNIPSITEEEVNIIKQKTLPYLSKYSYC